MIRVAIVDESVSDRVALQRILGSDLEISVGGMAGDGAEAVDLVCRTRPEVVTIGVDVEATDNLYAVRQIMAHCPTPILLLMEPGRGQGELLAYLLAAGALDAMEKTRPSNGPDAARIRAELLTRIKLLARVPVITHMAGKLPSMGPRPTTWRIGGASRAGVAIVSSTGGPMVLAGLLAALPADLPAPLFVLQHMAQGFIEGLAVWFQDHCSLRVQVAKQGDRAEPGVVLVGPDARQMMVGPGGVIELHGHPAAAMPRPTGDRLFQSVARLYGSRAIGVVLTGMGRDGALGAMEIKSAGGRVIAQDEATSTIYGMPRAAIEAGVVDEVLPVGTIAEKLVEWVERGD